MSEKMNILEKKVHNVGERLVPYVSHNENELIRHRSSYSFFYNVIRADQKNNRVVNPSVVDLGFGSGWGSMILSGIKNSKIIGVDVGEECVEYAKLNYAKDNIEYVIEDARKFVDEAEYYDYVVSRGVLEHIPGGLEMIEKFKFNKRIIIDVPYNEPKGNGHHLLLGITEKNFSNFQNCEFFYEDINGVIYKDYCPKNVNMLMIVISNSELEKIGDILKFPILPVVNQEIEFATRSKKQANVQWLERENLLEVVKRKIQPALIGIDVGTGIMPHEYLNSTIYVCCEPYHEYVNVLANKIAEEKAGTYVIRQNDWHGATADLKDKSVDSVYLVDVIEHLSKEEGKKLLAVAERIARKQIILFTPLGFIKQAVLVDNKDAWGLNGAKFQEHKSGWLPEDFDNEWDIYACEEYHTENNIGEKIEKPFGAFWAIKNLNADSSTINYSLDSLPEDVKNCLINELPYYYSHALEDLRNHKIILNELRASYQHLQSDHNVLVNSRTVRYGNMIKKCLRIIGIKNF